MYRRILAHPMTIVLAVSFLHSCASHVLASKEVNHTDPTAATMTMETGPEHKLHACSRSILVGARYRQKLVALSEMSQDTTYRASMMIGMSGD
jgi:hypothetical protein